MRILSFLIFFSLTFIPIFAEAAKKEASFLPAAFRAKYEQSYKSSLSGKEKKSWGMLDYEYPSKIRLETQKPDKIVFVSNPETTWYYTAPFIEGEQGELVKRPTKKNSLSYFFDALKNGLSSNKEYTVKADQEKKGQWIEFQKALKNELGIDKALLTFKAQRPEFKNLEAIQLHYTNGKEVLITLQYLDTEQSYPKDFFTFFPPENTKIRTSQ